MAGFEVKFARGENGDLGDGDDDFGAPERGQSGVEKLVAEVDDVLFQHVAADGGEEADAFALGLVWDADDGDFANVFFVVAEGLVDGGFHDFVGNHFAGNFGETGHAAFDEEKAFLVEAGHVVGLEPTVFKDVCGEVVAIEVAGEDIGTAQPKNS